MSYYWRIKWKDYNEQELLITETQGKYLNEQLVLENRPERFSIAGIPYRYDAIDVVEPTTKRVQGDMKALLSGRENELETGPVLDQEGFVIANWYKKVIGSKEYERYYASHPSYYTLERTDTGNIVIAFRRAEELNAIRPNDIELCNEQEVEKLWKSYGNI